MNTNKERAREELYQTIQRPSGGQEAYELEIIRAIRAYVLLVHTEACTAKSVTKSVPDDRGVHSYLKCGQQDWYCDVAQQYLPQK